jgi:hypothetical protein
MNQRAGAIAAFCAIAVTCAASGVALWRHQAVVSTGPEEAHARTSSEAPRPIAKVSVPAVSRRTRTGAAAAAPAPTAAAAVPANSSFGGFDEEALMSLLRSARGNDLALAIALAREGNRRFPGSSAAAERGSILIHALAEQGLSSEARGEAEAMVNRYPDSVWVHEIEQFTGARRHRNIRVGPDGELQYVEPAPPI